MNLAYHLQSENAYIVIFAENVLEFNKIVMNRMIEGMKNLSEGDIGRYYRMKECIKIVD